MQEYSSGKKCLTSTLSEFTPSSRAVEGKVFQTASEDTRGVYSPIKTPPLKTANKLCSPNKK